MADVLDLPPPDPLPREDRSRERAPERPDRTTIQERRRDRDPRERREEKVVQDDREERSQPRREYNTEKRAVPEDRSGSGLAPDRSRDRERDYKRRASPSPPPYPHRDKERRYSPSRRSPAYKRSRREEEYEGVRRGTSPRSSMMAVDDSARSSGYDRRYGYEGLSPFDRLGSGAAGRGSSYTGDERGHSRQPGSRSDWLGSGRSGLNDGPHKYSGAPRREGLMTYKQFISELEDDILPAEAQRRYEEYKNEFISTQKRSFFEQNKDEDWLRDKYDPARMEAVIQRRNENCREIAREFTTELEGGLLDVGPCASGKNMQETEPTSDEEVDLAAKRRRSGRGPAKEHKGATAPKAPSASSDPKRIAKDIDQARSLIRKLDTEKGIEGNILVTTDQQKSAEKPLNGVGIEPIVIVRGATQVKGYEGLELLDVLLTYLWRVHGVDYYGMLECKEPPKGFRHVRSEGKANDDLAVAAEWEKKLDGAWQARLQGQDPLEIMLCKEKMETALAEALDQHIRKIKDEKYGWKYGCAAKGCTKLFHGPEFVHKHLKLKHSDLVNGGISKAREELYFQNYMGDPDGPGGTPVMCQPGSRDRGLKQRHGLSGTVGADSSSPTEQVRASKGSSGHPLLVSSRGSRGTDRLDRGTRDKERYERIRDEERYDRGIERSPSRDYTQDSSPQATSGGAYDVAGSAGQYEGGRSETAIYNPFNGPGMRVPPPFGSEMPLPPPVLMPVPGAGPLGPFVPAPPEMAMRLMREQGGAPFYPGAYDGEAGGGSRTRKGRSGQSNGAGAGAGVIDGPPIILPLPPLRQDPRHLRSYRDLDAPEDEVTVIDYRSL